jgi:hypothetical protein
VPGLRRPVGLSGASPAGGRLGAGVETVEEGPLGGERGVQGRMDPLENGRSEQPAPDRRLVRDHDEPIPRAGEPTQRGRDARQQLERPGIEQRPRAPR